MIIILFNTAFPSGAFDHGTSTGKNKIQIDLTWNPFNYFEYGQNYVVISYGITDKLDFHAYYVDHGNYNNGVDSYYFGLFYQFIDSKYLDLASAIGRRKMKNLTYYHIFFPQLLYNFKLKNNYSIGGSIVNVKKETEYLLKKNKIDWLAFDIAIFIPFTQLFKENKVIEELKMGIGLFSTGLNNNEIKSRLMPTYSIDIKLNLFKKSI